MFFEDMISANPSGFAIVGIILLFTEIAIWIIRNLQGRENNGDLTIRDALIAGLPLSVVLISGISRSGASIVTVMLLECSRRPHCVFHFLFTYLSARESPSYPFRIF